MQRRNFLKTGALAVPLSSFPAPWLPHKQSPATPPLRSCWTNHWDHLATDLQSLHRRAGRRDLRRGVGGREIQNCEYRRHSHRAHRGSSGAGCPARRSQRNSGRSGSAGWRGRARPQYLRAAKRGRDQEGDGNRFGEGGAVHAAAFFRDPIHHYVGLEPVPSAVSLLTLKPS